VPSETRDQREPGEHRTDERPTARVYLAAYRAQPGDSVG
jgi:hypothetical protein